MNRENQDALTSAPEIQEMLGKVGLPLLALVGLAVMSCATPATGMAPAPEPTQTAASTGPRIGDVAPDFTLTDLDGKAVKLSDFRGKPVLVNFWASWCGPCRGEMPYLQQVYSQQAGNGLVMLAINIQETPNKVKQFLSSDNLSLPVVLDTNGNVSQEYAVVYIPTTFLIDSNGVIKQEQTGAFPDKQAIETELREIMP